jgi:adenine-specific DNA-methyltransferase
VRPEELSMVAGHAVDLTPNEFRPDALAGGTSEVQNLNAYLHEMVRLIRVDGLTFIGNKYRKFARLDPLFQSSTGSVLHAHGLWEGTDLAEKNNVAVAFGPQYGPVTAEQVSKFIRASRRYDELVIAGFSFDAEASAAIQETVEQHTDLKIHQAYISPTINPGMNGLLKETPKSQLFTVFGQPDVKVEKTRGGFVVELRGVDIYDPVANVINSTGAKKVAAWFLDGDYDGRCFCITQAFFPDQNAWEKIAKALKSSADEAAFAAFNGTKSLPFDAGKYKRVAIKVIDPRGNEVMTVKPLED